MAKKPEFKNVQIVREGETIKLPPGMTYPVAIDWMKMRMQEEDRMVEVSERMEGFPLDCANALALACQERYGFKELKKIPGNFFAPDQPPLFINVPIDHLGNVTEVFVGRFGVPKLDSNSYLEATPSGFDALVVGGKVRARELPEIKALVRLAKDKLKTNSLYKGKSIRIDWETHVSWMGESAGFGTPAFMPPKPPSIKLLVNEETMYLIEGSIWNMIRKTQRCREIGTPLKRAILAEGPFGTGKTLLAATTSEIASQHGWTFIYVQDVLHLKEAYRMAARYSPAVLFAEDIDQLMAQNRGHEIQNVLDGIDTKGAEVMLILTTNYAERLDQSMLRPGRLDVVIPFRAPDRTTVIELVRHYAGSLLPADADLTDVADTLVDRIPAVIREVVERAKLHALLEETPDRPVFLDPVNLLRSAVGMKVHLEMLDAQAPRQPKTAMEQFGSAFAESIGEWLQYSVAQATGKLPGSNPNVLNSSKIKAQLKAAVATK